MAESIKKFIIKDAHGGTKESGSFSVVGEVHVNIVPGYGEPYAESVYVNGILTITIHNIEGNGITEITTDSQEGDEAVNTVTIKTNANPEGVVLEVRNGSRGNGIASSSEVLSPEDGGTNTHTIIDNDGNEHVFHTKNGHTGRKGDQGDSVIVGQGDLPLANSLGNSSEKAITQQCVTDEFGKVDDYTLGKIGKSVEIDYTNKISWKDDCYIYYLNGNETPSTGKYYSVTNYIDISGCDSVSFVGSMYNSGNDQAAAFYNSSKVFIWAVRYEHNETEDPAAVTTYTADVPANAKYLRITIWKTKKSEGALSVFKPYNVNDAIDERTEGFIDISNLPYYLRGGGSEERNVTIPMRFGKMLNGYPVQGTSTERWATSYSKIIENKGFVTSLPVDGNVQCACYDENFVFDRYTTNLDVINAAKYIRFYQNDSSLMLATDIVIGYKGEFEYISEPRINGGEFYLIGKGNTGVSKNIHLPSGTYTLSWDSTWSTTGAAILLEISYYTGSYHSLVQKATIDVTECTFTLPSNAQFVQVWAKIPNGAKITFTLEHPSDGIVVSLQWFTVDVAFPMDNPSTELDGVERLYTNAYITLPYNYRQGGKKNKLIVYATGTTGAKWDTLNANYELIDYFNAMGYAVLVVNACTNKYKSSRRTNCATPLGVACFISAINYAIDNFNLEEGFYIYAKSAGGMTAMNLINNSRLHVKTAAIACPNLDVWNDYRCMTLGSGSQAGYLAQFNVTEYASWTAEAVAEMKTKQDLFDGYNPITFNCTIDKKAYNDYILDNDYPLSSSAYPNSVMKDYSNTYLMSETMQNLVKNSKLFLNAPVKIWYTDDDPQVPFGTIVNFAKMASNAGCVCKLRKFPDGSGGHHCADAMASSSSAGADLAPRVTIQTRYGGEMNIPLGIAEVLQWIELY